jgi:predicted phosphoadenosine phosphosulfate sulfurtransferase
MHTSEKIRQYETTWISRCYSDGIPDEVPSVIDSENLAPSWRRIAIALLRNDLHMTALGHAPKVSKWYGVLKRIELGKDVSTQMKLF